MISWQRRRSAALRERGGVIGDTSITQDLSLVPTGEIATATM